MQEWLFRALKAIVISKQYSNLYLNKNLHQLPAVNRPLARSIIYGVLQHYFYCEKVWMQYVSKKPNRSVGLLLTLAVYEMLYVDKMPDYAVIDETVNLAKKLMPASAGFINAILRKAASRKLPQESDPLKQAALEASLPEWLLNMWKAQYGQDEAIHLAQASNAIHPVYIRVNPLKTDEAALEKADHHLSRDEKMRLIYSGNGLEMDPSYLDGSFSIQDPGSLAIARFAHPEPGQMVLDVCAAPGTKTCAMAEMMNNQGHIDAYDLHEHRAKLIEKDARRLGIDIIHAAKKDALSLEASPVYDVVLCDVPCSGYGVLARKPDMKLKLDSSLMDELIPLQQEILEHAGSQVKDQGRLIYSTCTMNKKENEKQVEAFLKKHPEFKLEKMETILMDQEHDGFFMAELRKVD